MPYTPSDSFTREFVPYLYETPEAEHFMRDFNRRAMQWLIPLAEPLNAIEFATLSDMYDAEVAYQDHLLGQLISALESGYHRDHSMVIFLADHGEMLGEHGYMGHGFGLHEELIRVPLFLRLPEMTTGEHVKPRVSITQLFYTVLDYFGFESIRMPYADEVDIRCKSLLRMAAPEYCGPPHLISEAYSPDNAIPIMRNHAPGLIDQFHADRTYRAVYDEWDKMIEIEGVSSLLYDLAEDPHELNPYQDMVKIQKLGNFLEKYLEASESRRSGSTKRKISLKDEMVQQRLRDLGYIE